MDTKFIHLKDQIKQDVKREVTFQQKHQAPPTSPQSVRKDDTNSLELLLDLE